jgi:predicted RNase H-like HicB family nuclease
VNVSDVLKLLEVVVEKSETGYSANSPDLDGCIATGSSKEEVEQNMPEAMEFHLDGLRHEGYSVPSPRSYSTYIYVPV